ncbi:unnamed protein product [Cyclocybe aegerita]|uniref:Uncharacterized protein n=1 Tax=Cyclocybe aegerita TaxID=1973307 RepID=A0A8S0WSI3_CYCAE|nr:unnamed protein product [Cyclocybe aegerita]
MAATGVEHPPHPSSSRRHDSTFDGTRPEEYSSDPPCLERKRNIPLPPLSFDPISLNPLLQYRSGPALMAYHLTEPSSTAVLSRAVKNNPSMTFWKHQAAMTPTNLCSLTIRMEGIDRPIVVRPSGIKGGVVTVGDILEAVHLAVTLGGNRSPKGESCWWWAGLAPCPDERDVWILYTTDNCSW